MAQFKAETTKDTANISADTLLGSERNIGVDTKKGTIAVSLGSDFDGVIDVSNDVSGSDTATVSSIYKTVSISADYTDAVEVKGNSNVAQVIYAGAGGGTFDGGTGYMNAKGKLVTSADKFYGGTGDASGGADTFVYSANGGKDQIFNYGNGDVIRIENWNASTQSLSFVDKNGGLTLTINDDADTADGGKAGTTAKNSVLTVDGVKTKLADSSYGFHIDLVDADGGVTSSVYGAMTNYGYGLKGAKEDTTMLTIGSGASGTVDVGMISSTVKTINGTGATKALYIKGNANGTTASIGAAGGTLEGGYDTAKGKAVADNLYGTSNKAVTFVANGGKDVIYNYKTGDNIVYDPALVDGEITTKQSGMDITYTLSKDTSFTIKNVLGQAISINGIIDADNSHTLPSALAYDAKLSKITADASKIKVKVELVYNDDGTPKIVVDSEGNMTAAITTLPADPIYIGGSYTDSGENAVDVPFESTVTMIDLSASTAPVIIDTSQEYGTKVTSVSVGKEGGTVTGSATNGQTFTAGAGDDFFAINSDKVLEAETPAKAKADVITNFNASGSDLISIAGATADNLSVEEKGKDLNIKVSDNEGNAYTVVTVKNFDSDTGATILGDALTADGEAFQKVVGAPAMQTGVSYNQKGNKIDRTGIIAGTAFKDTVLSAEDYGGANLKTIDAQAVTGASKLSITGSSAANTIYAPTAKKIATTLDGGTGNDNLYGNSVTGGQTTYVFQPQLKGKKDVIYNFNDGDIIVIDQSVLSEAEGSDTLMASLGTDADGNSTMQYQSKADTWVDGFNDTKADVVISVNKSNTITIKNAAGKKFYIQDSTDTDTTYTFGHQPPEGLAYDAKNTTVSLEAGAAFNGTIDLNDYATYYSTIKKVDLGKQVDKSGNVLAAANSLAAAISGNTLANELIAGDGGDTLDGGAITEEMLEANPKIKPVADKLTGGAGADVFVYDAGYGKDSFINVESQDIISINNEDITADDLTITDKGTVVNVVIGGDAISTERGAINTTANSTFSITKASSLDSVHFVFGSGENTTELVYGSLPSGASYDDPKKMSALNVSSDAPVTVDASVINSQPKTIDARTSSGAVVLVGNANADAIYAGSGGSTLFGGTAGAKSVKDQLYGGAGQDYFYFGTQPDKGAEADIVYNYNYENGDVIVLGSEVSSVKADGKTIVLTFEEADPNKEGKTVKSTLTINGVNNDDGVMKKFDPITSATPVTFATGSYENGTLIVNSDVTTYLFDSSVKDLKGGKVTSLEADDENGISVYEPAASSQYAATDGWFNKVVSTDNASVSELDSILDVKGALNGDLASLDGDAFFTNTSFESKAAAITGARHRSKK